MTRRRDASVLVAANPSAASVRGLLSSASPIEFSQFLLLGRKTGALHLSQAGQRGVLYFHSGNIVSAIGPDLRSGEEAAMRLLAWQDGEFFFVEEPIGQAREIEVGTQTLLLETARVMDESGAEEAEVAASLKQVDELARTLAAITATSASAAEASSGALAWLLEAPGRSLFAMGGHPAAGQSPSGEVVAFEAGSAFDPTTLTSALDAGGAFDGWVTRGGKRLFLSKGDDGYRLLHPYPAPLLEDHIENTAAVEKLLDTVSPILVYGPAGAGKSLLAALATRLYAERGWRVLYASGLPSHDLGDGRRILHATIHPGSGMDEPRRVLQRWRPDLVVVDVDPTEAVASFARECRMAGVRLALTLRTAERSIARDMVRLLTGEKTGWQLLSPWPVSSGPKLDISIEAV